MWRSRWCCPEDRTDRLQVVQLLVQRDTECILTPDDDFVLRPEDEILFAGRSTERRALENTLLDISAREYVLYGRHVPSSWIWRWLRRGRQSDPGTSSPEDPVAVASTTQK